MKDPLYRAIVDALAEVRDGDLFEECVCDLLRDRYPRLVPIPGGQDAGMDGAIDDGEGEAYPLVCTTAQDVIRNLTTSLDRYIEEGGSRRRVVLTTSRKLTPTRRRNLRDRAREKGFVLAQVYERRAIAALLYRNPKWRKELLDLAGHPSALTVLPPNLNRPFVELELRGRDGDAEWLRSTSGDRVLVGAPGFGKSCLLYRLNLDEFGLFLSTDDEERFADAVREHRPEIVIVDDAHADPERLSRLRAARREIGADFDLVATTWPGSRDEVVDALGVSSQQVHRLDWLPRKDILKIYEEMGVRGSEEALAFLADQARNRPGLAVTLGQIWLDGVWEDLFSGESLRKHVLPTLKRLVGEEEEEVLAAFSLGGSSGMPVRETGAALELTKAETRKRLNHLSAAGVLEEAGDSYLAVQPDALRSALIASVFFSGATNLDLEDFVDLVPAGALAHELVATLYRYARSPGTEPRKLAVSLQDALIRAGASWTREIYAWAQYARWSREAAVWVVEHYPGDPRHIAKDLLVSIPEIVLPPLMQAAAGDERDLGPHPEHPLRVVKDWLLDVPKAHDSIERRHQILKVVRHWLLEEDGDPDVAFRVACLAISPEVEGSGRMSADRTGYVFDVGILGASDLQRMEAVWEEALSLMEQTRIRSWKRLQSVLYSWLRPASREEARNWGPTQRFEAQKLAPRMLADLVPLVSEHVAWRAGLQRLAAEVDHELPVETPEVFNLLHPPRELDVERFLEAQEEEEPRLVELAEDWKDRPPEEVIEELVEYENYAADIPRRPYPSNSFRLVQILAQQVENPEAWAIAAQAKGAPGLWFELFLGAVDNVAALEEVARSALRSEDYRTVTARAILTSDLSLDADLLKGAIEAAAEWPQIVETAVGRGEISIEVMRLLLRHENALLALAVAIGEWFAKPKGTVREEIAEDWENVIVQSTQVVKNLGQISLGFLLEEILKQRSDLAHRWLRDAAQSERAAMHIGSDVWVSALASLDTSQRSDLIERLRPMSALSANSRELVGGSPDLFRQLLEKKPEVPFRLQPLQPPDPDRAETFIARPEWIALVRAALDSGIEPGEIASATLGGAHTYWGTGLEYWQQWADAFDALAEVIPDDLRFREIVEIGRRSVEVRIEEARAKQREIDRHGTIRADD